MADWSAIESDFDRTFRSTPLAEPITFHPELYPAPLGVGITLDVEANPLRGVFSPVHVDVDVEAEVEVVTRSPVVEIRVADFAEPPKPMQQWTIRGQRFYSAKVEPVAPGWHRHRLHRTSPPSQAAP